jgi:hypothetical protein
MDLSRRTFLGTLAAGTFAPALPVVVAKSASTGGWITIAEITSLQNAADSHAPYLAPRYGGSMPFMSVDITNVDERWRQWLDAEAKLNA